MVLAVRPFLGAVAVPPFQAGQEDQVAHQGGPEEGVDQVDPASLVDQEGEVDLVARPSLVEVEVRVAHAFRVALEAEVAQVAHPSQGVQAAEEDQVVPAFPVAVGVHQSQVAQEVAEDQVAHQADQILSMSRLFYVELRFPQLFQPVQFPALFELGAVVLASLLIKHLP